MGANSAGCADGGDRTAAAADGFRRTRLAETVPTHLPGALNRTVADTLGAEVLPVMEACRFLERSAGRILAPKRLGVKRRPIWLAGLDSRVERAPWGVVLLIGAGNYPLLLAGVQAIQALVAGQCGALEAGAGNEAPVLRFGTADGVRTESGIADGARLPAWKRRLEAMDAGVDHVVLTGSAETGKAVLRRLAETLTPATMELSGCDAVFVLPGAELAHTVRALAFGHAAEWLLYLHGSAAGFPGGDDGSRRGEV
jgi:acyl-CoA reductase-like NAD-dependent aldehyde dehydrogenase